MNEKFNVKRFLITLGIVLFAVGATAGPTWYFMNEANKVNEDTIASLKEQNNKLSEAKEEEDEEAVDPDGEDSEDPVVITDYSNDYEAVVAISLKNRPLSKVGAEQILVRRIVNGWAAVDFQPYPTGNGFTDGVILKKVNNEWQIVATFDSSGNLTMKSGYKESDIPGTIYQ